MVRYRPEIDGLRALAVLGVFFYHLGWSPVKGGWLGVDVFFVISGYLICSLLLKELDATGTISLSGFYLRRVRRILPALLACLAGSFCIALLFSRTPFFTEYIQSLVAALFSASNIFFWQHSDYFALDSSLVPLLHTWSLGVEEQFYIIIPTLFAWLGTLGRGARRKAWWGFFLVMAASFLLCRYGENLLSFGFRFYMLPTRMWELAMGTFVALILHKWPQWHRRTLGHEILATAGLAFLIFALTKFSNVPLGEPSLFAAGATMVFLLFANERTLAGRFMSLPPLRFVGNISYSLYLWHWPLIVLWNIQATRYALKTTLPIQFAIIAAGGVAATLSWKYIETPFRRKKEWGSCLRPMSPLLGLVAVAIFIGFAFYTENGAEYAINRDGQRTSSFRNIQQGEYFTFGPDGGSPQFLLIGDSHAQSVMPAMAALADEFHIAGQASASGGVRPIPNVRLTDSTKPPFVAAWYDYFKKTDIPNLVLVSSWYRLYAEQDWQDIKGKPYSVSLAQEELRKAVLDLISKNRHVWIMETVPQFRRHPVFMTRLEGFPYSEKVQPHEFFAHQALAEIVSPNIHILDPTPYLVKEGVLNSTRGKDFLYFDLGHLTRAGAMTIKDVFRPIFESIRKENALASGRG